VYFFDTHTHILHCREGRLIDVGALLQRARITGVRAVLAPAVDWADWDRLRKIAPVPGVGVYFAWGLHPFYVLEVTPKTAKELLEQLKFRMEDAPERLRAIGECGLDFLRARTPEDREHQVTVFRGHLELARATGFPLSMHCVGAHAPLLELLREGPTPPSVMHAFSGSAELAQQFVAAGHYISFAGNLCLSNARKVIAAARAVPDDRVLLETDSPDQTPPNRRPADNEPAFIVDIAQRLASVRSVELAELARTTFDNACRVFRISTTEPFEIAEPFE
jgi:TatD DNase family protein